MTKKESFVINRIKSVGYAFKGALLLLKTEASIQVQFGIGILVTIAGFYFNINTTEWVLQVFAIGIIMSIEGLNTAVEKIADFVHPEHHKKIGVIKDVSAGAVFISAITAIIIGCIIYIPKLF
jgi:diacylglycerol kinase (ATP)